MTSVRQLLEDLDEITAPFAFYRTVKPIRASLAGHDINAAYRAVDVALSLMEIRGPMLRGDLADWAREAKAHSDDKHELRAAA